MKKMNNEYILDEIFEENLLNEEVIEFEDDQVVSTRLNIQWVVNKDTLEEIKLGVQNNIFTQASVKITPVMYLSKLGKTQDLFDLVKISPEEINKSTCNGRTPLMFAAQFGNINCLKLLILAGANLDAQDEHGTTALMLSAFMGQMESVQVLLENGANKMIKDCNGINAKMLSNKNGNKLIVEIIEEFEIKKTFKKDEFKTNIELNSDVIYI